MAREQIADIPDVVSVPGTLTRERVLVRRRRSRKRHRKLEWTVRLSRKRIINTVIVCAGLLVVMTIGLYLGLSQ